MLYGTVSNYRDITEQYLNGEINLQRYSELLEERSKMLETKNKENNVIDLINRKIITNN